MPGSSYINSRGVTNAGKAYRNILLLKVKVAIYCDMFFLLLYCEAVYDKKIETFTFQSKRVHSPYINGTCKIS